MKILQHTQVKQNTIFIFTIWIDINVAIISMGLLTLNQITTPLDAYTDYKSETTSA